MPASASSPLTPPAPTPTKTVLLLGKESVGKSALARGLAGGMAVSQNFRGTTVSCHAYPAGDLTFIDAPGLYRASDSETASKALAALADAETVLLVVQATHLDDDLQDLLPLAAGRPTVIAVTFWDRVEDHAPARETIARLAVGLGVPVVPVDARRLDSPSGEAIRNALLSASPLTADRAPLRAGWRMEPRRTLFDRPIVGQLAALLFLLTPFVAAVLLANAVAGILDPLVERLASPLASQSQGWPRPFNDLLAGDYGFLTMGPLLLVWAVPTVVVYALLVSMYKASGLVDVIATALHPLLRPVGLHGRDVTRVLMGFGCNVPAIVSTRSCAACTRPTTVGAIAFGSACSYQLGATLAVFAAAGRSTLVIPYLAVLVVATLVYTRLTSDPLARSSLNALLVERRTFLIWPRWDAVWTEAAGTIREFLQKALPIFFVITLIAALIATVGALDATAAVVGPLMSLFNLPEEAALPVVLSSVRKDGLLLLAEDGTVSAMTAAQTLSAVLLAGTLLPCLVTAFTVAREIGRRFAAAMLARQAAASLAVTLAVAWGGAAVGQLIA